MKAICTLLSIGACGLLLWKMCKLIEPRRSERKSFLFLDDEDRSGQNPRRWNWKSRYLKWTLGAIALTYGLIAVALHYRSNPRPVFYDAYGIGEWAFLPKWRSVHWPLIDRAGNVLFVDEPDNQAVVVVSDGTTPPGSIVASMVPQGADTALLVDKPDAVLVSHASNTLTLFLHGQEVYRVHTQEYDWNKFYSNASKQKNLALTDAFEATNYKDVVKILKNSN